MRVVAQSELNATDRLVAVAIAAYANVETGECWPGDAALSKLTGLSPRSHGAIRRRLIAAGVLERTVNGHGRSNLYRIVLIPVVENRTTARSAQRAVDAASDKVARSTARRSARSIQRANTALSSTRLRGRDTEETTGRDTPLHDASVVQASSGEECVPMPAGFKEALSKPSCVVCGRASCKCGSHT
jgi:hypothetical protein